MAGGVYGSQGFLGCMRRISVVGFMQKPQDDVSTPPEYVSLFFRQSACCLSGHEILLFLLSRYMLFDTRFLMRPFSRYCTFLFLTPSTHNIHSVIRQKHISATVVFFFELFICIACLSMGHVRFQDSALLQCVVWYLRDTEKYFVSLMSEFYVWIWHTFRHNRHFFFSSSTFVKMNLIFHSATVYVESFHCILSFSSTLFYRLTIIVIFSVYLLSSLFYSLSTLFTGQACCFQYCLQIGCIIHNVCLMVWTVLEKFCWTSFRWQVRLPSRTLQLISAERACLVYVLMKINPV